MTIILNRSHHPSKLNFRHRFFPKKRIFCATVLSHFRVSRGFLSPASLNDCKLSATDKRNVSRSFSKNFSRTAITALLSHCMQHYERLDNRVQNYSLILEFALFSYDSRVGLFRKRPRKREETFLSIFIKEVLRMICLWLFTELLMIEPK